MIRFLGRKKVTKRIFIGLAAVIIPSFLIWGVGYEMRGSRETLAAKVNRKAITRQDYYRHLEELLSSYRHIFGEELAENSPQMAEIKKAALEDLIRQTLLEQEARRRRVRVNDEEVVAVIRNDPVFRNKNDVFDETQFHQIVASIPDAEWRKIEDDIRQALRLRKLQNLVVSEAQITVSDQEVARFRKEHNLGPDVPEEELRRALYNQKATAAFEEWYQKIRKTAKVEVYL